MSVKDILEIIEFPNNLNIKIIGYDINRNDKVLMKGKNIFAYQPFKEFYDKEIEAINVKDDSLIIYIDEVR